MTRTTKRGQRVPAARIILDPQSQGWRDGVLYRGVKDPSTGKTWEWREADFPGLADFLHEWLVSWHPYASKGHAFRPKGRGASALRKAIAAAIKRDPKIKTESLWAALKAKPPRGWELLDNRAGRYAEGPDGNMNYARFRNIVSMERAKLKS